MAEQFEFTNETLSRTTIVDTETFLSGNGDSQTLVPGTFNDEALVEE